MYSPPIKRSACSAGPLQLAQVHQAKHAARLRCVTVHHASGATTCLDPQSCQTASSSGGPPTTTAARQLCGSGGLDRSFNTRLIGHSVVIHGTASIKHIRFPGHHNRSPIATMRFIAFALLALAIGELCRIDERSCMCGHFAGKTVTRCGSCAGETPRPPFRPHIGIVNPNFGRGVR